MQNDPYESSGSSSEHAYWNGSSELNSEVTLYISDCKVRQLRFSWLAIQIGSGPEQPVLESEIRVNTFLARFLKHGAEMGKGIWNSIRSFCFIFFINQFCIEILRWLKRSICFIILEKEHFGASDEGELRIWRGCCDIEVLLPSARLIR
jgi:hypothetical protein